MTMADFSMVEELAVLIKDNLSCKHLVLSVEEMLVNALQNNLNCDKIIELEPMSPYHRLMLHRLADIFGFAHESVGEGDDRHLVLQKCPDSSIPLVLVSDILLQYDENHPPTSSAYILRRESSSKGIKSREISSAPSLPVEERETAYLAARQRIFSLNDNHTEEPVSPKPRPIPAAARRMIVHALGNRISSLNRRESTQESMVNHGEGSSGQTVGTQERSPPVKTSKNGSFLGTENLERERTGAARRIFANALGLGSTQKSRPSRIVE